MSTGGPYDYDVAVSFAGEDRHHVEALVNVLKGRGVRVFYDRDEKAAMWGEDGYVYLTEVYLNRFRYCVPFCSEHYANKMWPTAERRAAFARAMGQSTAYILPVRLDRT